jgi:chemotaxis protein MotB
MGGVSAVTDGAMRSELVNNITDTIPSTIIDDDYQAKDDEEADKQGKVSKEQFEKMKDQEEEKNFEEAKKELMSAIKNDAQLKELAKNLIVDMTPEGLRIQIVDQQGKSMFPLGSAKMYDETYMLISKVAQVVAKLPNKVSVNGHTDGLAYGDKADYNNWDLSADRANASRRALVASGLDQSRIANVAGKADTDHLFPKDPENPQNRRISIILLRQHKAETPPAVDPRREGSTNPNYNQPFKNKD